MKDKKKAIFNSARKIFSKRGFKDTNVSEIAKSAGIGVGTFYNYYSSKEELFLEVFIAENRAVKQEMFRKIKPGDGPAAVTAQMMAQYVNLVNSNRIIGEWYNRDLFSKLEKNFKQQGGIESVNEFMYSDIAGLIKEWKLAGQLRQDVDDDMILALLTSIVYVDMHKTDIGLKYFPRIITLLYEFIIKGLSGQKK